MDSISKLSPAEKWVILLGGFTLALGLGNFGRALVAIHYAVQLPDVSTTPSLGYLAGMGILWGLLFIVCSIGLSRFREWGRRLTLTSVTLHQGNAWAIRLLFAASDYALRTRLRDLLVSAILLSVFWGSLALPPVKGAFRRRKRDGSPDSIGL